MYKWTSPNRLFISPIPAITPGWNSEGSQNSPLLEGLYDLRHSVHNPDSVHCVQNFTSHSV